MMLLHGEELIESYKILVPGTQYIGSSKIIDVIDKGKMTIVYVEYLFKESETKELACKVVLSLVIRG